jgi:hypothetical protein
MQERGAVKFVEGKTKARRACVVFMVPASAPGTARVSRWGLQGLGLRSRKGRAQPMGACGSRDFCDTMVGAG